ncbi:MAG: UDP-2,3-diacylglucosamine diphosphatase LpxI [Planctomycetota bacterium]
MCNGPAWERWGAHLRYFRECGVCQVTMAGKLFKHEILYGGSLIWRHLPDWTCIRTFAPMLFGRRRDARDDQLLGAVVDVYHQHRFDIRAATDLAPDLLVKSSQFQPRFSSDSVSHDAAVGWRVAKQMGAMDIGQSITVKDGVVLAVEAIEGTDACIDRTGELCRRGGWTLVKVSKPNQDMRFDVPTIGIQTIERVARAGGRAIVIEDGKTIVVQRDEVVRLARKLNVELVVLSDADVQSLDLPSANAA